MTPEQQRRLRELESFTTPDMRGFFPDQTAGRKSKTLTFFDTETDDRSRILSIAAHKVVFNYDKLRFENADESKGFFRVYNPVNVDKNIARTEGKHGLFSAALSKMRARTGANYSSNWDLSQYEEFKQWVGDSELAGHNIVGADLSWILRPTGRDFNVDQYKKGFFDTLHYAKGIVGNESAALQDLRKKYSSQLKGFNLEAHEASGDVVLNIKVLEQMIRSNLKNPLTAEALYAFGMKGVQTGWKQNLNLEEGQGQIIYGARGKPLHNLPYRNAKRALKGWKTTTGFDLNETYVLDLKEAFNIPQDVYDTALGTSGYLSSNYSEGPIGSGNMDKDILEQYSNLFDRYKALDASKVTPHTSISDDADARRAVRAFRQLFSTSGQGWDSNMITIPDAVADSMTAVFRQMGYNPSTKDVHKEGSLYQLYARRALEENAAKWWEKQVQYNTTAGNLLAKDKAAYSGQDWWQQLAGLNVNDVSPAAIEEYKASKKEYLKHQKDIQRQQKAQAKADKAARDAQEDARLKDIQAWQSAQDKIYKAEGFDAEANLAQRDADRASWKSSWLKADITQRLTKQAQRDAVLQSITDKSRLINARNAVDERLDRTAAKQEAAQLVRKGALFHSDLDYLNSAALSTKQYREEVEKLTDRNKRILDVTKQLNSGRIWSPVRAMEAIAGQAAGIRHAAHGILPSFLETPMLRFGDALGNIFSTSQARLSYGWDIASGAAQGIGAIVGGVASGGNPLGVVVGQNIGGAGVKAISNLVGGGIEKQIKEFGLGVQHRLNLLASVTTLLRGFGNGLKVSIDLFKKLGRLWDYMPSYTMSTATGVSWAKATGLGNSDRLFGFQKGTIASMYNELAVQQGNLYTSGMFDEQKLVAAARTGIFDLAYSPMGGNVEEQQAQIFDRWYKQLYESGASKEEQQSLWALYNQYDSRLAAMLERSHGMVESGFKQYRDYNYLSSMRGYGSLSTGQNAWVSDTATRWDRAKESYQQGISLMGARFYDALDNLLIKPINQWLWSAASSGKIDWKGLGKILENAWDNTIGKIDWGGFKLDLSFIDDIIAKIGEKLSPLKDVLVNTIFEAIETLRQYKVKLDIPGLIKAAFSGGDEWTKLGDYFDYMSPEKAKQKALAGAQVARSEADAAFKATKELRKVTGYNEAMSEEEKAWRAELYKDPEGLNISWQKVAAYGHSARLRLNAQNTDFNDPSTWKKRYTEQDYLKALAANKGFWSAHADALKSANIKNSADLSKFAMDKGFIPQSELEAEIAAYIAAGILGNKLDLSNGLDEIIGLLTDLTKSVGDVAQGTLVEITNKSNVVNVEKTPMFNQRQRLNVLQGR